MPIVFVIKHLSSKKYFKIRFRGRRGEIIGIKNFPLTHKRISSKLNDIFYWIHWEKLMICQVYFSVLSLPFRKIYYFRTFSKQRKEKHFRSKSSTNVRVSLKQSLMVTAVGFCLSRFSCLSKTLKEYGCILVFCCYCNKLQHIWCLKVAQIYYLTVM